MIFFVNNLIDETSELVSNSYYTRYPLSNLRSYQLFEYSKFSSGEANLDITLPESKTFDVLALAGHNLTSASVTIYSDAFISAIGTYAIDCTSLNIFHEFASSISARYIRISMADSYTKRIGFVSLGMKDKTAGIDPSQEWTSEINDPVNETDSFNIFGSEGYSNESVKVKFPRLTLEQKEYLVGVFAKQRNWKPFFVKLWNKSTDYPVIFARINQQSLQVSRSGAINRPYALEILLRQVQ